jgi:hypothetical protein
MLNEKKSKIGKLYAEQVPFAICCNNNVLGKDWFILKYNKDERNYREEIDLFDKDIKLFKANKSLFVITFQSKKLTVYERQDMESC